MTEDNEEFSLYSLVMTSLVIGVILSFFLISYIYIMVEVQKVLLSMFLRGQGLKQTKKLRKTGLANTNGIFFPIEPEQSNFANDKVLKQLHLLVATWKKD